MPALPLAARVFILSFLPLTFAMLWTYHAITGAVRERVRVVLEASVRRVEAEAVQADAEDQRRDLRNLSRLGGDPGLRAAWREAVAAPRSSEARRALAARLRQLQRSTGYDLILVSDARRSPIAAAVADGSETVPLPQPPAEPALVVVGGVPYRTVTRLESEDGRMLGSLTAGRRFDLRTVTPAGYGVLLQDGRMVAASAPSAWRLAANGRLPSACVDSPRGCEQKTDDGTVLIVPVQRPALGRTYRLLSVQSLDAGVGPLTQGLQEVFSWVGIAGVMIALCGAALASHWVSKPLTGLIARLKQSERLGRLTADVPLPTPVTELNRLAEALHRTAAALDESQHRLNLTYLEFVETMAQALDARDPYTAGHSQRVSRYSAAIAHTLGLSPEDTETIRVGALLHDIGKIGVPDAILQKPGLLDEKEFAQIRRHPQIGRKILEKMGQFENCLPIVELHHEDHDGRGYPHGLRGDAIPIGARIVHVADAYDAMTTDRAYRKALPVEKVRQILWEQAGSQFDPRVVDALLAVLPRPEFRHASEKAQFAATA